MGSGSFYTGGPLCVYTTMWRMVNSLRPSAELEEINACARYQADPLSQVKGFIASEPVSSESSPAHIAWYHTYS